MAKNKKNKKPKLPSVASLRRKAMKLWTEKVKNIQGRVCTICGARDGADNDKGGKSWINAHHIEDRTNYALRWDILNGIALCPKHHEFGKDSAHRSPVWFLDWLRTNRPKVIDHIIANRAAHPQTADKYSREDMMRIVAGLSLPPTDEELAILNIPPRIPVPSQLSAASDPTPPQATGIQP